MEKVELIQKKQGKSLDYEPVTLDDGTTVDFSLRESSEGLFVRASAKKGGNEIAYGSWSTKSDIFSVRVNFMSKSSDPNGLARIILDGILQIVEGETGEKTEA
jgi:hypothetical protein